MTRRDSAEIYVTASTGSCFNGAPSNASKTTVKRRLKPETAATSGKTAPAESLV